MTWSPTLFIVKKTSKIKEAPFTDNYCKLKKVNLSKPIWKSPIVVFIKTIKWDSPFSVIFTTCRPFPDKWSKITTTPITLGKISSFAQLETSIMKLFIKQLKGTFQFQNKKLNQLSLSNPHSIQESPHWKVTWLLSSIWSQFMRLRHFSTMSFSVTFYFKELSLIDQILNLNWKSWKVPCN